MPKNEEIEDVIEVPEITLTTDESGNDTTDWKAIAEANREIALKNLGIAKRNKTRAEKAKNPDANPAPKKEPIQTNELDYGQLAYLTAKGIESDEDVSLAREIMKDTGRSLKDVVGSKYFQAELKEKRELRASAAAIPEGTKRGTGTGRDGVDYWLAKGEMPPVDQVSLRREYVNARLKKETSGSKFTTTPVIS